jgi:hypothetical protein
MPKFLSSVELKARSTTALFQTMESRALEDKYIVPAEKWIEGELGLALQTSQVPPDEDAEDVPASLRGTFDAYPAEKLKFIADYKRAVIILCDRMALNPNDLMNQSVSGASATFGRRFPREIYSIMAPWLPRQTRTVVR